MCKTPIIEKKVEIRRNLTKNNTLIKQYKIFLDNNIEK